MKLMDKAKQAALAAAVKTGLGYLEKDPEVNIPKLMELVDKFVPDGWYECGYYLSYDEVSVPCAFVFVNLLFEWTLLSLNFHIFARDFSVSE